MSSSCFVKSESFEVNSSVVAADTVTLFVIVNNEGNNANTAHENMIIILLKILIFLCGNVIYE